MQWHAWTGWEGSPVYIEGSLWQYVGTLEAVDYDASGIAWATLRGALQLFGEGPAGPDMTAARPIGMIRVPHTQVCATQPALERWPDWRYPGAKDSP